MELEHRSKGLPSALVASLGRQKEVSAPWRLLRQLLLRYFHFSHFPDRNKRAGIFAGKEVTYLQAVSDVTSSHKANSPCPLLLPGGCTMFTHPYAMLSRGREVPAPWERTVLPKHSTSQPSVPAPVLDDCFTEFLHPHLNICRGAENAWRLQFQPLILPLEQVQERYHTGIGFSTFSHSQHQLCRITKSHRFLCSTLITAQKGKP